MRRRKAKQLLTTILMLLTVLVLSLPTSATNTAEFCEKCEADCYEHADNVKDYNACVLLCNYAGNCGIPIIQRK